MAKPRPLKGKRKYLGPGNLPDYWLYKHRHLVSAVEWLKKEIQNRLSIYGCLATEGCHENDELNDVIDEAFHDVTKED